MESRRRSIRFQYFQPLALKAARSLKCKRKAPTGRANFSVEYLLIVVLKSIQQIYIDQEVRVMRRNNTQPKFTRRFVRKSCLLDVFRSNDLEHLSLQDKPDRNRPQ
jgi:hypothetical protein